MNQEEYPKMLLWLLIADVRNRSHVLLNEIRNITQSSRYLSRLTGEKRVPAEARIKEFFGAVENLSDFTAKSLKQDVQTRISLEWQAIQWTLLQKEIYPLPAEVQRLSEFLEPKVKELKKDEDRERKEFFAARIAEWNLPLNCRGQTIFGYMANPLFTNPVISVFERRGYYLRELQVLTNYIRLCHKGLSEQMESLPPYSVLPSRFYRKEVKRNFQAIDQIFRSYTESSLSFLRQFVLSNPGKLDPDTVTRKLNILMVCEHDDSTYVRHYRPMNEKYREEVISSIILQAPYWLMEMPRYIPVLSHEIAHALLEHILFDLNESDLVSQFKDMRDELRGNVGEVIHRFASWYYFENYFTQDPVEPVIIEALVDVISLIVSGPAFLMGLFLSVVGTEPVSKYVIPDNLLTPNIRLRLCLEVLEGLSKNLFDTETELKRWLIGMKGMLEHYEGFFRNGGFGTENDAESYKSKIEFQENLFQALKGPVLDYIKWVRKGKESDLFEIKEIAKGDPIWEVLNQTDPTNFYKPPRFIAGLRDTDIANIPNVIWAYILTNFQRATLKVHGTIPEGRILRALLSHPGRIATQEMGDCFELLFYNVNWSAFTDEENSIDDFLERLKGSSSKYRDSSEDGEEYFASALFGEYDFFLIRSGYKARTFDENWPPRPYAASEAEPGKRGDGVYHIKHYTYREIISLYSGQTEKKLIEQLKKYFNDYGCLAFTQLEFSSNDKGQSLKSFLGNQDVKEHFISVLESTAWDDFLIFWNLKQGLESFATILNLLKGERQQSKTLLRSVTHLLYDSRTPREEDSKGTDEIAHASTRITLPRQPGSFVSKLDTEWIEGKEGVKADLFSAFGVHDIVILWKFSCKFPFAVMKKKLNELIKEGCVEDCVTHFLTKIKT